jgi:hypothetical protein
MAITTDDVRTRPHAAPTPPASGSWRLELSVAALGLVLGLLLAAVLLT